MLHYILQTIAFQAFFLLIYDLFLKKETFFNWNRAYLLLTAILSIVLPFIKVNSFKEVVSQEFIIRLPEVVLGQTPPNTNQTIVLDSVILENASISILQIVFFVGVLVAFGLFLFKFIKILFFIYKNPKHRKDNTIIITILNSNAAFSFFNYIFLGEHINAEDKITILKHEITHVKQKHTLDLLFFEVLRIAFWFNPFVYIYQKRIMVLHEFIADDKAIKNLNKIQYYQNLLAQVFETKSISFINTFFKQSLIKKRIVMLSKTKSKQIYLFKYVLLIPMVISMLIYTSCEKVISQEKQDNSKSEILNNIEKLKESIAAKGQMTEEEEKALKTLMMLVTENGLNEPFFQDVIERAEIPFGVIEQVPLFPGCEGLTKEEQKKCMAMSISEHFGEHFNVKLAKDLDLKGKQRINVIFKIDTKGNVVDVKSRAPHPALEAEAIRVVKMLPKFKPGKHNGKIVSVPYSLPIIFQVSD